MIDNTVIYLFFVLFFYYFNKAVICKFGLFILVFLFFFSILFKSHLLPVNKYALLFYILLKF